MSNLVLLSGGLDSYTLMMDLIHKGQTVNLAVSFDYGQNHRIELEYAARQAEKEYVSHLVLDIKNAFYCCNETPLISGKVPDGANNGLAPTYVPNRNMVMLSIAAAQAYSMGIEKVLYAAHASDAENGAYPDCTQEFVHYMDGALKKATGGNVRLSAPFLHKTKREIVELAAQYGIDFEQTYSCYRGGKEPCGKCAACLGRKDAVDYYNSLVSR